MAKPAKHHKPKSDEPDYMSCCEMGCPLCEACVCDCHGRTDLNCTHLDRPAIS